MALALEMFAISPASGTANLSATQESLLVGKASWLSEAHKAGLALDELALFEIEDSALGRVLASLGRAVQQRESAKRTES